MSTITDLTDNEQTFEGCMACEIYKNNLKAFG